MIKYQGKFDVSKESSVILGNVEESSYLDELKTILKSLELQSNNVTVFIFNKNSYGAEVLKNSLNILSTEFSSIVYLYQNPVHQKTLIQSGFDCFLEDDAGNTAHKNYKYRLYLKHS